MGLTPRELFAAATVLRRDGRLASSDVLAVPVLELRGAGLNASDVISAAAAQARKAIDLVDGIFIINVVEYVCVLGLGSMFE